MCLALIFFKRELQTNFLTYQHVHADFNCIEPQKNIHFLRLSHKKRQHIIKKGQF
jgi:hypothetical protein